MQMEFELEFLIRESTENKKSSHFRPFQINSNKKKILIEKRKRRKTKYEFRQSKATWKYP